MALLVAVPLLALVLVRMLWSGSSLWFLTVGLILLGGAAVVFLARRQHELEYDQSMGRDTNRAPLILAGLGVLFLAMLLLPNFADGGGGSATVTDTTADGTTSDVAGESQPPAQQPPVEQPPAQQPPAGEAPAAGQTTHIVESGDTLWDIAQQYGTTVDAIVAANSLPNATELQVGQELVIPSGESVAP
jgi:LPXTG-motif cell wall-anchored protein